MRAGQCSLNEISLVWLPGGLLDAHVSGKASDLAGDPLHAGLALDDGVVDVAHTLNKVVHGVDFWINEKEKKPSLDQIVQDKSIINASASTSATIH